MGEVGPNFGAGMTGGMAYLYDPDGTAMDMLNLETLVTGAVEVAHWNDQLLDLIKSHAEETGSLKSTDILQHWDVEQPNFIQICPKEMLNKLAHPLTLDQGAIPAE